MTRRPVIAGNWKMHNLIEPSVKLTNEIMDKLKNFEKETLPEVIVAPVYTALESVNNALKNCGCGKVQLGAQNCYFEPKGAYTGEVAVEMLIDVGCKYIIIGHSERRTLFFETDEMINKKAKAIVNLGVIPIICCGESLEQRENGETDSIIESQIKKALDGITNLQAENIIIAYEPIWAIGTGKTCDSSEANRVIKLIRQVIENLYDSSVSSKVRILYGGSVKPETIEEQMAQSDIDGALVGGASLNCESFVEIVKGAIK